MATSAPHWLTKMSVAPNALYRCGMGGLLGRRFLQLTHVGRMTGIEHTVVLEVVHYDRDTGEAVVMCDAGERAEWLLDLGANGDARVSFGRAPHRAEVRLLDADEAVVALRHYEQRYGVFRPVLRKMLSGLAGFDYRGTDEDRRRLVEKQPLMGFRPA